MQIELYEALTSANVAPDKAKAVVEAYRREAETRLATKDDLNLTKSDLRTEIAALRTEMHLGFKDQIRWLVGTQIALAALIIAGLKLIP